MTKKATDKTDKVSQADGGEEKLAPENEQQSAVERAEADGVPLADMLGEEGGLQFAESVAPGVKAELDKWQAEAAEWKDKALRAIAEEENTRARLQRERGDMLKFAQAPLAMEIFEVADILGRAIASLSGEGGQSGDASNILDGLRLTEGKLREALQKHNISSFGEVGDKFDAALHQAVSVVDRDGYEANSIVEVLQSGYVMHDRVLRAAMVVVAKP